MSAPTGERLPIGAQGGASKDLALLNHDLRAAISDVIGGLRLVDHAALVPDARIQLERVRTAGEALARLMDDGIDRLIDPSLAKGAQDHIQLARLVHDLEMRWSGRAAQRRLTFAIRINGALPEALNVNRVALERILSNALSNAIKFSDSGQVDLEIAPTNSGGLRLTVSDRGPGFSAQALGQLFEYQGRPDGAHKPGQGMGLHIISAMALQIGARIAVENRAGGGACITVELPKACVSETDLKRTSLALPDLSCKKVLLADDTPTNQTLLFQMLTEMGAEVVIACDGVQAMDWLSREIFDLAVIDIEMPKLSGTDVIWNLRTSTCRQRGIPILAVTAHASPAEHERILAAGASAILQKPLPSIDGFGKALHDILGTGWHGAEAPLVREGLNRLIQTADPKGACELLTTLLEDLQRTGKSMEQAMLTGSAVLLKSSTHVLISLAGTVEAGPLLQLAHRLNSVDDAQTLADLSSTIKEALAEIGKVAESVKSELLHRGMV